MNLAFSGISSCFLMNPNSLGENLRCQPQYEGWQPSWSVMWNSSPSVVDLLGVDLSMVIFIPLRVF